MSINRILSNGVLGVTAQSHALGTISDNIANARTVGYKRTEAQFSDYVMSDRTGRSFDGAGVRPDDRLRVDSPGALSQTQQKTNAAIVGNGFFLVQEIDTRSGHPTLTPAELTEANRAPELTRAGDFQPDQYGHLVNSSGRALMGLRLENSATRITAGSKVTDLELVSLDAISAYSEPTTRLSVTGNLPPTQPAGEASPELGIDTTVTAVDNQGDAAAVGLSFVKTGVAADGTQSWNVIRRGVTYEDGSAAPGTDGSALVGSFTLGTDGTPSGGTLGSDANLTLNLGPNFQAITLNLGQYGAQTGIRSVPGTTFTAFSTGHNGIAGSSFRDVEITADGYVRATYTGGQSRDFYKIPNAVVVNTADLESVSGAAFRTTAESGGVLLREFGKASTPSTDTNPDRPMTVGAALATGAVEQSNTSLEEQFTTLIKAQRTYTAATKIISTADEMSQTVLGMKA